MFKIFVRIFASIGIIFGTIISILAFTTDENLYVTNYVYSSQLIDNNLDGYKIVQLSDFHNHKLNYKNGYLSDLIKKENPNAIFLTGDFIDQYTTEENIQDLRTLFNEIKEYPTYYIVGNHESYASYQEDFYKLICSYKNITFLFDNFVNVTYNGSSFSLIGLRDPLFDKINSHSMTLNEREAVIEPTLKKLSCELNDDLKILLSHRPDMMDLYAKYNMDLVFSGHTHGGQIGFFPSFKYQSGLYKKDNTTLIVSNGISYNGKSPIRVACPMQLVSVVLKSA